MRYIFILLQYIQSCLFLSPNKSLLKITRVVYWPNAVVYCITMNIYLHIRIMIVEQLKFLLYTIFFSLLACVIFSYKFIFFSSFPQVYSKKSFQI